LSNVRSPATGALADAATRQIPLAPLAALPVVGALFLRGLREPSSPRADVAAAHQQH
jgi:FSR family fosmidomycin resistance protein-like MFS transporter